MHFRQAISIEATPDRALEAARIWMRHELRALDGEITEGSSENGSPAITSTIVQDGIRMRTSLSVDPHIAGSKLTLELCTEGVDLGARIRNVGLLPGKKLVAGRARESLLEIKANANQ